MLPHPDRVSSDRVSPSLLSPVSTVSFDPAFVTTCPFPACACACAPPIPTPTPGFTHGSREECPSSLNVTDSRGRREPDDVMLIVSSSRHVVFFSMPLGVLPALRLLPPPMLPGPPGPPWFSVEYWLRFGSCPKMSTLFTVSCSAAPGS